MTEGLKIQRYDVANMSAEEREKTLIEANAKLKELGGPTVQKLEQLGFADMPGGVIRVFLFSFPEKGVNGPHVFIDLDPEGAADD